VSVHPALMAGMLLLAACAGHTRHTAGPDGHAGPWRFEGDPALGEIRVVPTLHAFDMPALRTDGYVTEGIVDSRVLLREQRMRELSLVPDEVGVSLPGAIHARLNEDWDGHFKVGHLPLGARGRLENALRRGDLDDLELALGDAARGVGGQATLFTWITHLAADPLTAEGFPGDRIDTAAGPVVLNIFEEPYRVRAEIGMALVRSDGLVVLRYADHADSLLSPERKATRVGRDLAAELAQEVAKMWPDDPRLWRYNPTVPAYDPLDPGDPASLADLRDKRRTLDEPGGDMPSVPFTGLRKASESAREQARQRDGE